MASPSSPGSSRGQFLDWLREMKTDPTPRELQLEAEIGEKLADVMERMAELVAEKAKRKERGRARRRICEDIALLADRPADAESFKQYVDQNSGSHDDNLTFTFNGQQFHCRIDMSEEPNQDQNVPALAVATNGESTPSKLQIVPASRLDAASPSPAGSPRSRLAASPAPEADSGPEALEKSSAISREASILSDKASLEVRLASVAKTREALPVASLQPLEAQAVTAPTPSESTEGAPEPLVQSTAAAPKVAEESISMPPKVSDGPVAAEPRAAETPAAVQPKLFFGGSSSKSPLSGGLDASANSANVLDINGSSAKQDAALKATLPEWTFFNPGTSFGFQPVTIEDFPGIPSRLSCFQTICFMDIYKKWSTEELRLADYGQGRRHGHGTGLAFQPITVPNPDMAQESGDH